MRKDRKKIYLDPEKWPRMAETLKAHFESQQCFCLENQENPEERIFIPVKKRGNNAYQKGLFDVFRYINTTFKNLIQVDKAAQKTNSFMITLSMPHSGDLDLAWSKSQKMLSEYFKGFRLNLKKQNLSMKFAWAVYEPHEDEFPHIHIVVVLDQMMQYRERTRRNGKGKYGFIADADFYRVVKQEIIYKTDLPVSYDSGRVIWKKARAKAEKTPLKLKGKKISHWEYGFIDASAVYSKTLAVNYLSKYLIKGFKDTQYTFYKLEKAFQEGKAVSLADFKKVLGIYRFVLNKHMKSYRLYGSRDLINFRKTLYKKTFYDFTEKENLFKALIQFCADKIETEEIRAFFSEVQNPEMIKKHLERFLHDNRPYDLDDAGKKIPVERTKWRVQMTEFLSDSGKYYCIPTFYNLSYLFFSNEVLRRRMERGIFEEGGCFDDQSDLGYMRYLGKIDKVFVSGETAKVYPYDLPKKEAA